MVKGSIVALVTPFTNDKKIDYSSLEKICQMQIEAKTKGLLLLGTTQEAESLSMEEKHELLSYVINKVKDKISIIVGLISNKLEDVLKMEEEFQKYDIDAYLVIPPYYIKTNDSGLLKYFTYLADRSSKPLILYNVPKRVGMEIPIDIVTSLSYHKNIIGIKDASDSIFYQQNIINKTSSDFLYYSGNDELMLTSLLSGADGIISVIGNAFPNEMTLICNSINNKNYDIAKTTYYKLYDLIKSMYKDVSPIGIKYVLYLLGIIELNYRVPLDEPRITFRRKIEEELIKIIE